MILVSLRDLQFRRRRFFVAIAGTSLVLGLTLVLAGVSSSFDNEADRTVDAFHATTWIVPKGVKGPLITSATLSADLAEEIATATGAQAVPVAVLHGAAEVKGKARQVNVMGLPPGTFAAPPLRDGRQPERSGEVVVDSIIDRKVGDTLRLAGTDLEVVGRTKGLSYVAGTPTAYVTLEDAQRGGFNGSALASTIVVDQEVAAPEGFDALTNRQVLADILKPLENPRQTITMVAGLLYLVAAMIIGSVVYLSALDRVRDFAVFKAMGASDRSVLSGLLAQSVLLCAIAYAIGVALSTVLGPLMPMASEISDAAYGQLAAIALLVSIIASIAAVRRALSVDPALAFGGA
jgi:putative ABC transport system permease protein